MHEKKNPNRPLIVYYIIALVVVMLLNALLFPQIERYSVKQVDYSEFLSMLEDGKVKSVEINDTQIAFTPVEQIQDGKATYYTTNRVTADHIFVHCVLLHGAPPHTPAGNPFPAPFLRFAPVRCFLARI